MKNRFLLVAAAACFAASLSLPAEAMPLSSPNSVAAPQAAADGANLILVRQGCGRGFHRGGRGFCRPNRGWRGRYWRGARRCFTRHTRYGFRRVCRY